MIFVPTIIALGAFVFSLLNRPVERTVEIANLNEFLEGNKTDEFSLELIKGRLYETINYNIEDESLIKKVKILVRDGSYEQTYNSVTGLNKVSFIVDIEEIQQSYLVSYEWDDLVLEGEESDIDEWGTEVTCLNKDQLIYGEFDCQDRWTFVYGVHDPIANILPHIESNRWAVYYIDDYKGNIYKLQLDIYACIDSQTDPLEEEAKAWMRENIPDLDTYRVDVTYCKG